MKYPDVMDVSLVGTYSALAKAGGGYIWDEVLEYRVWCHPERGASDEEDGSDYYYPFSNYEEALAFSEKTEGAEEPLALILQREYISEEEPEQYVHIKEEESLSGLWSSLVDRGARQILFRISCRQMRLRIGSTSSAGSQDSMCAVSAKTPNKPFQRTRSKQRASER